MRTPFCFHIFRIGVSCSNLEPFCNFHFTDIDMNKTTVVNVLRSLPETFPLDVLLERLIVAEKIEQGLDDVKHGRLVDHDEVKMFFKTK